MSGSTRNPWTRGPKEWCFTGPRMFGFASFWVIRLMLCRLRNHHRKMVLIEAMKWSIRFPKVRAFLNHSLLIIQKTRVLISAPMMSSYSYVAECCFVCPAFCSLWNTIQLFRKPSNYTQLPVPLKVMALSSRVLQTPKSVLTISATAEAATVR